MSSRNGGQLYGLKVSRNLLRAINCNARNLQAIALKSEAAVGYGIVLVTFASSVDGSAIVKRPNRPRTLAVSPSWIVIVSAADGNPITAYTIRVPRIGCRLCFR